MAADPSSAKLLVDADGKPIPQYFNPTTGVFEAITGSGGATDNVLTGSNATKITSDGTSAGTSLESTFFPNNDAGNMTGVYGLNSNGFQMGFNGATWDRQRNNTQGTLLASAARTATTSSPIQTNFNARGVIVYLNVTVVSGTGGLELVIKSQDPISSNNIQHSEIPTAIIATGSYAYLLYPGAVSAVPHSASGYVNQVTSHALPRTFYIAVIHGDSTSYTYSVGYALIN